MRKLITINFFLILAIAACTPSAETQNWATPITGNVGEIGYPAETQTASVESTQTAELTANAPTADTRLLPEDWQNWPMVPEVTNTAREIYRLGIGMGNDPQAFSKVGDCQNLKEYFLGRFDHLDIYQFDWKIEPYLDTIKNFAGNFDRDGQSAHFGFTAASPISQLLADPDVCLPEETPLECEIRINRPMFLLVSLEFPFNGRTPELYEQYLRRIIEYTISQGVVPILSTKADNVEGDHSINLTVAKLAFEYDIPLWNWWAAAQPLGDHGIDVSRDEGLNFHITQQAWEERSKTFLQVLDHLWKGLRDQA
jgi:hypothetical protein